MANQQGISQIFGFQTYQYLNFATNETCLTCSCTNILECTKISRALFSRSDNALAMLPTKEELILHFVQPNILHWLIPIYTSCSLLVTSRSLLFSHLCEQNVEVLRSLSLPNNKLIIAIRKFYMLF